MVNHEHYHINIKLMGGLCAKGDTHSTGKNDGDANTVSALRDHSPVTGGCRQSSETNESNGRR